MHLGGFKRLCGDLADHGTQAHPEVVQAVLKGRAGGEHCPWKAPAVPDKQLCRSEEGELVAALQVGGSPGTCAILLAQRAPSLGEADKAQT